MNHKTHQTFHQIWLGKKPIPKALGVYARTWRDKHPTWVFELWDDVRSNELVQERYPQWWQLYNSLPYAIQKVDIVKYLILYEFGGVYIDLDYECLKPIDALLTHPVCIGLEPRDEGLHREFPFFLGSAFGSTVGTPNRNSIKWRGTPPRCGSTCLRVVVTNYNYEKIYFLSSERRTATQSNGEERLPGAVLPAYAWWRSTMGVAIPQPNCARGAR